MLFKTLIFSIGIVILLTIPYELVFAEEFEVIVVFDSDSPEGCENRQCVIPDELYIQVGDTIHTKVEKRISENNFVYNSGCNFGIGLWYDEVRKEKMTSKTFQSKGIFEYKCMVNPWKKLTVYVNDVRVDTPEQISKLHSNLQEQRNAAQKAREEEAALPSNIIKGLKATIEGKSNEIAILEDTIENKNKSILDLKFKIRELQLKIEELEHNEFIPESGIAKFVDPTKDPQYYVDRYNKEPEYKKWFHENYPQYDSIEQAVGLTKNIPSWVKNIFGWYATDQVSEEELLNAIKYLISEKILIIDR